MPCRALEAFRPNSCFRDEKVVAYVLMPCRALEAFRLTRNAWTYAAYCTLGLNALSGIGGVQTEITVEVDGTEATASLNALSGIGGVQTATARNCCAMQSMSLNALSGIGGVQTTTLRR